MIATAQVLLKSRPRHDFSLSGGEKAVGHSGESTGAGLHDKYTSSSVFTMLCTSGQPSNLSVAQLSHL